MNSSIYFGDLHTHCDIAYGHGTLSAALKRARAQLDFCTVTGQAAWPDMLQSVPPDEFAHFIKAHDDAFAHFTQRRESAFREIWDAGHEGEFVTFPSYEVCCSEFGDHTIVGNRPDLAAHIAPDPRGIAAGHDADDVIIFPHHIGYIQGYRGINWDAFDETISPFVEIYSLHGCSDADESPQPMQFAHRMSFRDGASTVTHALRQGKKFGIIAGTDHHAGWPGSHGHGRVAVHAPELTRASIWQALKQRHVHAVTGDKIRLSLQTTGGMMGDVIAGAGSRAIAFGIEACDFIDTVDLLRNEQPVWRARGPAPVATLPPDLPVTVKLRLEWGGVDPGTTVDFHGRLVVDGDVLDVEPCFRGPSVVSALQDDEVELELPHQVTETTDRTVAWTSRIQQPEGEFWSEIQALNITLRQSPRSSVRIEVNGQCHNHQLADLLDRSISHQLRGLHREGIRLCRAVPESAYRFEHVFEDAQGEQAVDCYRLRVRQTNDQYAWSSPLWIER